MSGTWPKSFTQHLVSHQGARQNTRSFRKSHVKCAERARTGAAAHPQRSYAVCIAFHRPREAACSSSARDGEQGLKIPLCLTVVQHYDGYIFWRYAHGFLKSKNYTFYTNNHFVIYTQCQDNLGKFVPLFRRCLQMLVCSSTFFFLEFFHRIFLSPFCSQMVLLCISLLPSCNLCHPQQKSHK